MPATIKIKNSSTASAVPTSSDLVQGELAVNVTDKRLFTENASGTVVELGTNPTILTMGAAGSASAPVITRTGDTNTGIFFPAADTIAFAEGGVEALRLDSAGNMGLGTTSPRNVSGYKNLVIDGSTSGLFEINTNGTRVFSLYGAGNDINLVNPTATGTMQFYTNNTERMRLDASGNLGIGTTSPAISGYLLANIKGGASTAPALSLDATSASGGRQFLILTAGSPNNALIVYDQTAAAERARIDSSGNLLVGMTSASSTSAGFYVNQSTLANTHILVANTRVDGSGSTMFINRQGSDGTLIEFRQADTAEGSISVSGTTVSYNGGHLARYAQTVEEKDESIKKGTVLSNLDEMNTYTDSEDNPIANEQLNKVKVSDVEGDVNVAGVFVNWSHDEKHEVDEINMAMTGDMIIRIAQGTTVARGDLLMSAGDGTAKPQGDDIVRAKTIAKVTSTHVTCTYEDGSYCVPCVLMAC